ncbi:MULTISPECIES: enolase N-terminal-like fold-containing protein [Paracoccus]|uniref:enolase N-terminal-like fold-containing protein n=1 Tax=Paracoccus TaxID=265 RepID=UPI003365002B
MTRILGAEAEARTVGRATLGLFFVAVTLDSGHTGLCATPLKDIPEAVCCPSSAMAMPFPGKLRGMGALRLAQEALSHTGLRRALGIAALNALAHLAAERRGPWGYRVVENADAFDIARIRPDETAVVVGAFGPFLKALRGIGARHFVLEKDPATLRPRRDGAFPPRRKLSPHRAPGGRVADHRHHARQRQPARADRLRPPRSAGGAGRPDRADAARRLS